VTSIASTMISLLIAAVSAGSNYVVEIDAFVNGVLICCVFAFGNRMYLMLFGCCSATCRPKLATNAPPQTSRVVSKSGSDELEV